MEEQKRLQLVVNAGTATFLRGLAEEENIRIQRGPYAHQGNVSAVVDWLVDAFRTGKIVALQPGQVIIYRPEEPATVDEEATDGST